MTRSVVPCGTCHSCCRNEAIILHPECGDDASTYLTRVIPHPLNKGEFSSALQHKPNGDCVYLSDGKCSIWKRAPAICREFDCRKMYQIFTNAQRRNAIRAGVLDREVMQSAKERLGSL